MQRYLHRVERILVYVLFSLLPVQLGKHFWPSFASLNGIRVDYLSPTLYVTDIVAIALLFCWLGQRRHIQIRRGLFFFIVLFLSFSLSVLLSSSHEIGIMNLIRLVEWSFVGFVLAKNLRSLKDFLLLGVCLSCGVLGESLLAFLQSWSEASLGGVLYWLGERSFSSATPGIANASFDGVLHLRPYGTFPHPNVLAGYLLCSLTYLLFFLSTVSTVRYQLFFLFTLSVGTIGLFSTFSRSASILWIAAIVCFIIVQRRALISQTVIKHICILALVFLGSILLFGKNMVYRFHISAADESIVARELLLNQAARLIEKHPIFGIGLGNYIPAAASPSHHFLYAVFLQPVHNAFLLLAAETGLVGFILVLWFLFKTYQRLFILMTRQQFKTISCLSFVLVTEIVAISFIDHYLLTLHQGQMLLSLAFGISWSVLFEKDSQKAK
jgi:O-antigen ligase